MWRFRLQPSPQRLQQNLQLNGISPVYPHVFTDEKRYLGKISLRSARLHGFSPRCSVCEILIVGYYKEVAMSARQLELFLLLLIRSSPSVRFRLRMLVFVINQLNRSFPRSYICRHCQIYFIVDT